MPIDASIPLGYQPPQLINPSQLLSLKDAQTQAQIRQMQLAEELRQQKVRGAVSSVWSDPANIDPQTGQLKPEALARLSGIDPAAGEQARTRMASTAELQARTKYYGEQSEDREQKIKERRVQFAHDGMASALDAYDRSIANGATPDIAKQHAMEVRKEKIDEAESSGLFSPEQIKQVRAQDFNPERARSGLTDAKTWLEQQKEKAKVARTPESPVGKAEADYKAGLISKSEKDALVKKETHIAEPASAGGKATLSEAAIDQAARTYLTDGKLPTNLGRGMQGANNVSAILNRAAVIDPEANIAASGAGYKADTSSLTALTKQYDAVTSFEKTAIRNGDRLLQLADKADTTGVPAMERWIRAGRQATGSPDVAAFHAQMLVYRNEAAKILTNPNLSGQLTDASRREVTEFLSGNASAPQIRAVVSLLKNDFENRKKTLEEQINDVKGRLTSEGKTDKKDSATSVGKSASARIANDVEYNALPSGTVFVGPDGKTRRKP